MKTLKSILVAILLVLAIIAGAAFAAYTFFPKAPAASEKDEEPLSADTSYNILLCGTDGTLENADVMVLITFDPAKKTVKLLSLPRDTMSNADRGIPKLNAAYSHHHLADIAQTKKEITMLTGLSIDRYVVTTFEGFEHAIDALGGVPMKVPFDLYYLDPYQDLEIDIKAGQQVLNGKKALGFVRYRAGYAGGDLSRIQAQQLFFKALAKTLLSPANITKIPALANVVSKDMSTDMTLSEMLWFGKQLHGVDLSGKSMKMFMLPGTPDYIDEISYFIPSRQGIVNMLNKEYPKASPWTGDELDLVSYADTTPVTYGYGSDQTQNLPELNAPSEGENADSPTAEAAPQGQPAANYGYGNAYVPPAETNTNAPARGYTEVPEAAVAPAEEAPSA